MPDQFDINKYVGVFLEEADEHIERLEENLVQLEKEPGNRELVQAAFRSFHTIKGSSGSMGFARMMELAHIMENVLEGVRGGRLEPAPLLIDALLRGVDLLKILRNDISFLGQEPDVDIGTVVSLLKSFLSEKPGANPSPPMDSKLRPERLAETTEGSFTRKKDLNLQVILNAECSMKGVRAYLVINRLQEAGVTAVSTNPSLADLETENFGQEFTVIIQTEKGEENIRRIVESIAEIDRVEFLQDIDQEALQKSDVPQKVVEKRGEEEKLSRNLKKTVRVDVERLDALLNLVGELVIDRARLEDTIQKFSDAHSNNGLQEILTETTTHIGRVTNELQMEIMKARMLPLSEVFNRFPRMVRDLARQSGKDVDFIVEGEETELDRSLLEEITDPLIHLLRNAVDHGIEEREERLSRGKPERGTILLKAYQEENSVVILIRDDGKGMSLERLRSRMLQLSLFTGDEVAQMTDQEVLEIIFTPGFSTSTVVTDVSGRGVGMDIVKKNIERVNGQVLLESDEGKGTSFYLRLPLTLAIVRALLIKADHSIYALPLNAVVEIEKVERKQACWVNKVLVSVFRDQTLPLLRLDDLLRSRKAEFVESAPVPETLYVIVVKIARNMAGLVVDEIIGEQEIVIKSLGSFVGDIRGLGGATILGDGRISLILDVASLLWKFSHVGG
ncbi:MAG TPA: chemotaxis protein CheA [Atribacteraceae bacterium]|nr:chemotaxis protein CheA [Atribacteraceae bacterium]